MCAIGFVGDAFDSCAGDETADQVEFCGARLLVSIGNRPDSAAVEIDPIVRVADRLEIGQIALLIEKLGENSHLLINRLAGDPVFRFGDMSLGSPLEDPVHQLGVLFLDVLQKLDRQVALRGYKEPLGGGRRPVFVCRSTRLASLLAGGDETSGPQ